MAAVVVIGSQWGDEGKGKITDYLAEQAQVIVRYQGGNNAGHTVVIEDQIFKLHLIPSGIFYKDKICVIGNGVVVDPQVLIEELDYLEERGISTERLRLSSSAHIIMPYHKLLDELEEAGRGQGKIGTTKRGIGPAYKDKVARVGIRVMDLLDEEEFARKLRENLKEKNLLLTKIYDREPLTFEPICEEYRAYSQRIRKYVTDTVLEINERLERKERVLFEGAQGILLDLDHGTYPYVTSSNPVAGGACVGAGVGPTKIQSVVGVVKAYTTRVGEGPFPTELEDEIGVRLLQNGGEYGTTTGRARRCGWFDALVAGYSVRVSGISQLALTKLDVLSGLETIKICSGYLWEGEVLKAFPQGLKKLAQCQPVYEEVPGWREDLTGVERFEDLPQAAQNYVTRIEELLGVPVAILAVGPERRQTILRKKIF